MIRLKNLLREDAVSDVKQKLTVLYKQYEQLLTKMYGPDGTETRKAAALVKHMGSQAGTFGAKTATSPEFDKIQAENADLMKQMSTLGKQMNTLYDQLESAGQGQLVKQMRDYQAKQTEKFVLSLADKAEEKSKADADAANKEFSAKQQKGIVDLEKAMKANNEKYRQQYRDWLQGPQDTPPPLPPSLPKL